MMCDRRCFLRTTGAATAALALEQIALGESPRLRAGNIPSYLRGYESQYAESPRSAAKAWFADARYGLFMHYGLYSQLGEGEWVMLKKPVTVPAYMELQKTFAPKNFDADRITDMALASGMKYVNITSRHHDGFSLFETAQNDYHAMASPARRDLVGELAEQCASKGLGLFLYYSYAADWWHPWFYDRDENAWPNARPDYAVRPKRYRWKKDEDFRYYIDDVHAQLKELLTNYGPLAGIWFDPIMGYYNRPDLFPIEETYSLIRRLQPQTLISFKQGANGTEDFAAPERSGASLAERVRKLIPQNAHVAEKAWAANKDKHNEICDTLQPHQWGYTKSDANNLHTPGDVVAMLANAKKRSCNLLLNTGPLPDGSINPPEAATFLEVGRRLRDRSQ